jgi:hypothetical protein
VAGFGVGQIYRPSLVAGAIPLLWFAIRLKTAGSRMGVRIPAVGRVDAVHTQRTWEYCDYVVDNGGQHMGVDKPEALSQATLPPPQTIEGPRSVSKI